jgi:hypothetical protein
MSPRRIAAMSKQSTVAREIVIRRAYEPHDRRVSMGYI